jgi:hypothetical protein
MGKDSILYFNIKYICILKISICFSRLHGDACRTLYLLIGYFFYPLNIFLNLFSYSKGIQTPGRHVRTRLYFTSESHVHSLLTAIRYGGLLNVRKNLFSFKKKEKIKFVI